MKRRSAPDPRRAKIHYSYDVAELARLFGVHRNTIRSWLRNGLETFKAGGKTLALGGSVRDFLEKRRKVRRVRLRPGWLYCMKCRDARLPAGGMAELVHVAAGSANVRALCDCGSLMHRRVSLAKLDASGFGFLATAADSHLADSPHPSVNSDSAKDA